VTTALKVRVARGTWVPVEALHEAALAVRQHIDAYGLGSSNWGQAQAPVQDADGKTVALISYNGRVWSTERDWQQRHEITGADLHVEGGTR
jgi:hypothetical protein